MRLEQFIQFVEAVRQRSISSASRRLHIPQQSLSASIAALENELGVMLLSRSPGGVRPTAIGLAVYDFMDQFLRGYRQLADSFHTPSHKRRVYHIPIAAQNNMLQTVIPQLTSELLREQDNITLDVLERPQDEIIAMCQRQEIAMGIILRFVQGEEAYPQLPDGLVFHPLFSSRPYFWLGQGHPLARRKSLSMEQVSHYPIVQNTSADEKMFQFIFAQRFGQFDVGIQTANLHLILQLVRENGLLCPDLKMQRGQLALSYLFHDQPVIALPLSAKDNYQMITGYLIKQGQENAPEMCIRDSLQ